MAALPSGTVTFLFTDIEGSTRLLAELGAERYADALAAHRVILREVFAAHDGVEVDTQGDAFFYAFATAGDALAAAASAQRSLDGLVRVRMGVHTGEPLLTDDGYVGTDVHRAARIAAAGHGGQVLVSQSTRDLVIDANLRDLGEHRLKDLARPERIWQLGDDEFPQLRSLRRSNLPIASSPLLGRARELALVEEAIRGDTRLLTITGAGGSGKTRLALQAAAELSDEFPGGAYFVSLAPLRLAAAVRDAVGAALELQPDEDVIERLRSTRALVVLDNAEHLAGIADEVAPLRVGESVLLVTSRSPLHLSGEHELPLAPLEIDAAAELFVARAADHGRAVVADETIRAICRRVDGLPLAVELAAARLKLLGPSGLLARLERALPLLEGGAHDAPARQQTLRATIEWSYSLLDEAARAGFRRLAVFRGTFGVEAAEAVANVPLSTLEALVDQSLLKAVGDSRLLLLETLREFAHEELELTAEVDELERRHADYYAQRLREIEPVLRGPRTRELLAWFLEEEDNLRAMLDRLERRDVPAAVGAAARLASYWTAYGRLREGRRRLEWAVEARGAPDGERAKALRALADVCGRLGETRAAWEAAREAAELAAAAGDLMTLARALHERSWAAKESGDPTAAVEFAEEAWHTAEATGDARLAAGMADQLGGRLIDVGRLDEAERLIATAVETLRAEGDVINEAIGLSNLGFLAFRRGEYGLARDRYERCVALLRALDLRPALAGCLLALGRTWLLLADVRAAAEILAETLEIAVEIGALGESLRAATWIAFAGAGAEPLLAVRLAVAALTLRSSHGVRGDVHGPLEDSYLQMLCESVDPVHHAREARAAELMSLDETYELARSLATRTLDSAV